MHVFNLALTHGGRAVEGVTQMNLTPYQWRFCSVDDAGECFCPFLRAGGVCLDDGFAADRTLGGVAACCCHSFLQRNALFNEKRRDC